MIRTKDRALPRNWGDFRASVRQRWLLPVMVVDWLAEWAAYWLSRTSLLEFLEYCGSFSILIGVIFYFIDAPQRTRNTHYQAWQVINTAQGKGGSGGRSDALHELNDDRVPLVGVDLSGAFLEGLQLKKAEIRRCDMRGADLKNADLNRSNLEQSDLEDANFRNANLTSVNFTDGSLKGADLTDATLAGGNLHNAGLEKADLTRADLAGVIDWKTISSIRAANIHLVKNAPAGFVDWAKAHGAVDVAAAE